MEEEGIILRRWTSRIRTSDEEGYRDYVARTGLKDYRSTPGNCGCEILMRPLGNGETEVSTLSWWSSFEAIRGFAGEEFEIARYYPEDDQYLLEKPLLVEHHKVFPSHVRSDPDARGEAIASPTPHTEQSRHSDATGAGDQPAIDFLPVGLDVIDTANLEPVHVGEGCRRIDLPSPPSARLWIVDMDANAVWPHVDEHGELGEFVFVVSGSVVEGDRSYGPGTFLKFGAGSSHQPRTATGVRLLGCNPRY